ncbi:O-antigen ligase family protein [Urechidicola croceus]|nr:O-antigen ligase family protein [Urechidicola croceus]
MFPIVLFTKKNLITKRFVIKLIEVFTISLILISVVSILTQLYKYLLLKGDFNDFFLENKLSTSVNGYYFLGFSLFISFAIISTTYIKLFKEELLSIWFAKTYYFYVPFLSITLILLNSRSLITITTLLFCLIFITKSLKEKKYKKIYFSIFILVSIFILNYKYNQAFNEKIKEAINYNNEYSIDKKWGGRAMRLLIWDCTLKVVNKNPLIGVGTGDQQDELTLCYKIYMKNQLLYKGVTFNAHNIFLQILLSTGIFGLFFFTCSILYSFFIAYKRHNIIYILFLVIFILSGLTESFFERNFCVAFFTFFNSILFLYKRLE